MRNEVDRLAKDQTRQWSRVRTVATPDPVDFIELNDRPAF